MMNTFYHIKHEWNNVLHNADGKRSNEDNRGKICNNTKQEYFSINWSIPPYLGTVVPFHSSRGWWRFGRWGLRNPGAGSRFDRRRTPLHPHVDCSQIHRQSPAAEEKYSPVHRLERRERDTQGEVHVEMETHILLSTDCVPTSTSDKPNLLDGEWTCHCHHPHSGPLLSLWGNFREIKWAKGNEK